MYDPEDIGYVDTFQEDLRKLFKSVSSVVEKYNSKINERQLAAVIHKGKDRYREIDIVDAIHNDVVLLTAFYTRLNKTTNTFIIPLDATINEEVLLKSIEAKLSFGMFYIMVKQKEN